MAGAKFIVDLVDKVRGPAKSMAKAMGGLDEKFKSITNSKAYKSVDQLGGKMASASKVIVGGAAAAAAAVGALVAAVSKVAGEVDALGKQSTKLNFPIKELQQWEYIAGQSGVETGKFNDGLKAFTKVLGQAKAGSGPLLSNLEKLNPVLLDQLMAAENSADAFELYMSSLRDIEDPALRSAAAMFAFEEAGIDMALIAGNSADAIADLKKEAEKNGLVTEEQAAAASKYQDTMDNLKRTISGVITGALMKFAPAIEQAVGALRDWIVENKVAERVGNAIAAAIQWVTDNMEDILKWAKWIGIAVAAFLALTGVVKAVVIVMKTIAVIGKVIAVVKSVGAIFLVVAKVIGGAVAAVVGAVGLVPVLIGAALIAVGILVWTFRDEIVAFFQNLWSIISGAATTAWEKLTAFGRSMMDALMGAVTFLKEGALSVGRAIVDGIVAGLNPMAIVNKVRSMGSSVLEAAKGIFGIASPSKEFAWMGEMNVVGMAEGMEDSIPFATRAANDVGDEVMDAVSVPSVAAGGSDGGEVAASGGGVVIQLRPQFIFQGNGSSPEEQQEVADSILERVVSALELVEATA